MKQFLDSDYIEWIDTLAEQEYVVIDNFLNSSDLEKIQSFFKSKLEADDLEKAGIGALSKHTINPNVRGDYICWLNQENDQAVKNVFIQTDILINKIKRYCFLSISDFECHLAYYPKGSFYKAHFDQFKERNNRILSFVLYLNHNWKEGDGGELIVHKNDKKIMVEPIENRVVLFKSESVLHEVTTTYEPRFSLAGWMLNKPVGLGFL